MPWLQKPASTEVIVGSLQKLLSVTVPEADPPPVGEQPEHVNSEQQPGAEIAYEVANGA